MSKISQLSLTKIVNGIKKKEFSSEEVTNVTYDQILPQAYVIKNAYPNPFNPVTTLSVELNTAADVSVKVYNLTGQLVAELANSYLNADNYQFTWNANMVPSGMYILRTEYAGNSSTQKLMLLK